MQNAKQEELFEEVEVVDDADQEEKGSPISLEGPPDLLLISGFAYAESHITTP